MPSFPCSILIASETVRRGREDGAAFGCSTTTTSAVAGTSDFGLESVVPAEVGFLASGSVSVLVLVGRSFWRRFAESVFLEVVTWSSTVFSASMAAGGTR